MLKIDKLCKQYNNQPVLNQVSLDMGPKISVIIGLNGSGKSTLLKVVAGIVEPDSGTVYIDRQDITALDPEERKIGYVPQHPALFNHLTALENMRYCLKNGRGSEKILDRYVEMLGLKDILTKKPRTLSGGFKSRVSLVRSLASQPKVMLLDEPLSDIDVAVKEKLLPEFKKVLKDMGIPTLYVTHDPWEASLLGDNFYAMVKGKITEINSADDAFDIIKASYNIKSSVS